MAAKDLKASRERFLSSSQEQGDEALFYRTITRVIDREILAVPWANKSANFSKARDKGLEWGGKKDTLNVNDIFFPQCLEVIG